MLSEKLEVFAHIASDFSQVTASEAQHLDLE